MSQKLVLLSFCPFWWKMGAVHSSEIVSDWDAVDHQIDHSWNNYLLQPVLYNWYNKGHGLYRLYKRPLTVTRTSNPWISGRFLICGRSYDLKNEISWGNTFQCPVFFFPASAPRYVMVHIKEPLLLIKMSSPCSGGSRFPLSKWSFTI